MVVQLGQDDPGLYPHPSPVGIDFQHPSHVLGEVELNAGPHGLPALGGASAPGRDRYPVLAADAERGDHVLLRARNHHACGKDLVDAGVGGVDGPRELVEANLALQGIGQRLLQRHHAVSIKPAPWPTSPRPPRRMRCPPPV